MSLRGDDMSNGMYDFYGPRHNVYVDVNGDEVDARRILDKDVKIKAIAGSREDMPFINGVARLTTRDITTQDMHETLLGLKKGFGQLRDSSEAQ